MPQKKPNGGKRPAGRETRENKERELPSKFKQDIVGILLIAISIFIFISNLSSSTGLVGLFIIKKALRSVIGVGIYVLPLFTALYGAIMLVRHEVKELTVRLTGLLLLFLIFISVAQFFSADYFTGQSQYEFINGAGGAIGFAARFAMEKTIGLSGSYVLLSALFLIASLLIFNITVQSLLALFLSLFVREKTKEAEIKPIKPPVAAGQPLAKHTEPKDMEVIPAPPVIVSLAKPPVKVLSLMSPVRLSAALPPTTFSTLLTESKPVALFVDRSTVTACAVPL